MTSIENRHLRYFVAVAEEGSFRAAATRLHVSQPPLTRQIQQLEERLGVTLVRRLPRGIELTAAGRSFFREARNILQLTEQAADHARLAGEGVIGRLDVGIFGSAILGTIPRLILAFRQRHPRVNVVLHNMNREAQLKALRDRRLLVGFNRFFAEEPDLTWETVKTESMQVAVHSDSPLARRASISLKQLAAQPLIAYPHRTQQGRGFNERLRSLFEQAGLDYQVVQEVDDVVIAVSLVSSGFGCTLVVESASALALPGVSYVPLRKSDAIAFDLCMIYRTEEASALLREFIAVARATAGGSES